MLLQHGSDTYTSSHFCSHNVLTCINSHSNHSQTLQLCPFQIHSPLCCQRDVQKHKSDQVSLCLDHQPLPNASSLKPSPLHGLQGSRSFRQLPDLASFLPGLQKQIAYTYFTHHASACKDVLSVWETFSFTFIMLIPAHAPPLQEFSDFTLPNPISVTHTGWAPTMHVGVHDMAAFNTAATIAIRQAFLLYTFMTVLSSPIPKPHSKV